MKNNSSVFVCVWRASRTVSRRATVVCTMYKSRTVASASNKLHENQRDMVINTYRKHVITFRVRTNRGTAVRLAAKSVKRDSVPADSWDEGNWATRDRWTTERKFAAPYGRGTANRFRRQGIR